MTRTIPSNATAAATTGFAAMRYGEMAPPIRAIAPPARAKKRALPAAHVSPSPSERLTLSRRPPVEVREYEM